MSDEEFIRDWADNARPLTDAEAATIRTRLAPVPGGAQDEAA